MARVSTSEPRRSRELAFDVVIPTLGRPSLAELLSSLARCSGPRPASIVIADDRRDDAVPLNDQPFDVKWDVVTPRHAIVRVGGRGPAAARNAGWRRCSSPWVVFVDDDVVPDPDWLRDLADDITGCSLRTAAIQGRLTVPLPQQRRATDYERNVARLEHSAWITADLAVRRQALLDIGGFDERFRRAYREDTDLALRLMDAGWELAQGTRRTTHPVRSSSWRTSVAAQRGNADDALMRRLHGSDWRTRGNAPRGALGSLTATAAISALALVAALARRPRLAAFSAAAAVIRTARFWARRALSGPGSPAEWSGLAGSTILITFAAPLWRAWGFVRALRVAPRGQADRWGPQPPALVLFDRDGTLIHDVPYNGDPTRVVPVPGAEAALNRLREAGVAVGMITNQSGVGRGLLSIDDVHAANARTEHLLGPFAVVEVCPHLEVENCRCRKPAPGMVVDAARRLGVEPERCAVVGDIGSDVRAAVAAGARGLLVPTLVTSADEIVEAPEVVSSLGQAVDVLLGTRPRP